MKSGMGLTEYHPQYLGSHGTLVTCSIPMPIMMAALRAEWCDCSRMKGTRWERGGRAGEKGGEKHVGGSVHAKGGSVQAKGTGDSQVNS